MDCKTSIHGAFSSYYSRSIYSEYSYSNKVPSSTTLTYEGLFNENFFPIKEKETKAYYNFELSNASMQNPITNKREYYLGILLKSKYDGVGLREPIDIGLSIDVSGSMLGESIEYTKKSVIKFIQNLNENDNICINTFNHEEKLIIPFQKNKNMNDLEKLINSLEADGGTELYKGVFGIYRELKKNFDKGNKTKRIILITDMLYRHDEQFIELCHQMSKEKIYLTILGISNQFNTELAGEVSNIKGSNYYVITNLEDIDKYLVHEFNYICFPTSFSNKIEINSPSLIIESIIGTGKKKITKDIIELEWNQENHKLYNQNFKDGILCMLYYFKKKGISLPKPVILCISKYIQTTYIKTISEIDTLFPSALVNIDDKFYVKGGMFLLRLKEETLHKNNFVQFNIRYKNAIDDKNYEISSYYEFNKREKDNYFSDKIIENALGLYYFAKFNRILMKYCNNEMKSKNDKYIKNIIENNKIDGMKEIIKKYLDIHYHNKNNIQNYEKYISNMEKIAEGTKEYQKNKEKK